MTMHLVRGMTTLNTKNRKPKSKTQAQKRAEAEHAEFLRSMGVGKSKSTKAEKYKPEPYKSTVAHIPSVDSEFGACTQRKENVYTGTEIIGIATMHKSNMVPIRGKKSAEEVAKMRRG